uniref:Uncharacterized protein n=1 Tax=Caenorhabditis japonica TaxID=281687 RepID=A0A8R1DRN5_CAEJA
MLLITATLFAILFSSISTSGVLRLEFTSSKECVLNFTTNSASEFIFLPMDRPRTISFHTSSAEKVRIFKYDVVDVQSRSEFGFYTLTVGSKRKAFTFGNVLIFVKSVFECDAGFTGVDCMKEVAITSTTSTSTISPTTPTTSISTTTTTTSGAPVFLVEETEADAKSLVLTPPTVPIAAISIAVLLLIVILLLLIILGCSCFQKNTSEVVNLDCESPLPEKKDFVFSDESPRYTAAPYTFIEIVKVNY